MRNRDILRMVPTFSTVHTFCASPHAQFSMGGAYYSRDIFAQFKTMRRKQNIASALGIHKKIGGNHAFFRDTKASIYTE